MILVKLSEFYDTLVAANKAPAVGWDNTNVYAAIQLDDDGSILNVIDMRVETVVTQKNGKQKTALKPQTIRLPIRVGRSRNIVANHLWDDQTYALGLNDDNTPHQKKFAAFKETNFELLDNIHTPAAEAMKNFLNTWNPDDAPTENILQKYASILSKGAIVFRHNDRLIHNDPEIRSAYQKLYEASIADPDAPKQVCMDTNTKEPIKLTHSKIMRFPDGKSTGCSLVSGNLDCSIHYGWKQNACAPMSIHVAENYVKAINYMLTHPDMHGQFGQTVVLCWSKSAEPAYSNVLFQTINRGHTDELCFSVMKRLCENKPVDFDEATLDPNMEFYILGLTATAGRLSIRFFLENTFGHFLRNMQTHYDRLNIMDGSKERYGIPLYQILYETINQSVKQKNKAVQQKLSSAIVESIFNGTPYPEDLIKAVNTRIRAEIYDNPLGYRKAAIIKAYYSAYPKTTEATKGALTMSLNPENRAPAYVLGRLFAVIEFMQRDATAPQTNVRSKFFNSASTNPEKAFSLIIKKIPAYQKKLQNTGKGVYYDKIICELMDMLDGYPKKLNRQEQAQFQLGYYHQRSQRFVKSAKQTDNTDSNEEQN